MDYCIQSDWRVQGSQVVIDCRCRQLRDEIFLLSFNCYSLIPGGRPVQQFQPGL